MRNPYDSREDTKKLQKIKNCVRQNKIKVIYAQTLEDLPRAGNCDIWYKVFIFTPCGCMRLDTSYHNNAENIKNTKLGIRSENLKKVTLRQLLNNYEKNKLFSHRTFERELIEIFKDKDIGE